MQQSTDQTNSFHYDHISQWYKIALDTCTQCETMHRFCFGDSHFNKLSFKIYSNVNVFGPKLLTGDTIFTSPTWDDTASLQLYEVIRATWRSTRLHTCSAKGVPLACSRFFLNTLSIDRIRDRTGEPLRSISVYRIRLSQIYNTPRANVFTAGENILGQATVMYGSLERPPQDTWDEFDL